MLILLLLLFVVATIVHGLFTIIWSVLYKIKIDTLLESINSKEDFIYVRFNDLLHLMVEVFKRKGYKVRITNRCGEEGNGLILNDLRYVEIWKHSLNQLMDVEAAMKLEKCMRTNSIYRGMLITLGDFRQTTKMFCHKNVIECINGEQLLAMCKEVQKKKAVLETG